jgi:uncharacterized protein
MALTHSLTGRVVFHSDIVGIQTNADRWWGDPPWLEFMARNHGPDLRFLMIEDSAGALCAIAPLLIATADRGPSVLKAPEMTGDEQIFGDESRLTAEERAEYDALRAELDAHRPAQYPTVSVTTRGASHGVALAVQSPVSRDEVLAALPGLLAETAAELGCRSHAVLHLDDDLPLRTAATELGYERVVLGAETTLDIPAVSGQEEYFAGLRSRRRTRQRKEMAQYVEQGLRTVVRTGRDAITEDLVRLQAQLRAKHGVSGGIEPVRREFGDIRDIAGESTVVLTAERAGQVLGFALCLHDKDRDELYARSVGFDYDQLSGSCYLALTYQEIPAWAADHGVSRVYFGMSTYEAKRARGCDLLPLYGYLRFDGPGGDLLRRAARLQSLGEARRLESLGAPVTG